ncbi:MAG: hypothetical protein AAGF36_01185 [Pseudomonadota bacterium]
MSCFKRFVAWSVVLLGLSAQAPHAEPAALRGLADQAVLVHRVTKSACLILAGAQAPLHTEDVAQSTTELLQGVSSKPQRPDETDTLAREVRTLTQSARQIAAGDHHSAPVTLLLRANPHLAQRYARLQARAPSAVKAQHRGSYMRVHVLRVVSQAFQRDLCLFRTDLEARSARDHMFDQINFFETSIDYLIVGNADAGFGPAPDIHIKITLGKVLSKWKTLRPILAQAAAGLPVDQRDIMLASVLGDAILANLDEISDRFLAL